VGRNDGLVADIVLRLKCTYLKIDPALSVALPSPGKTEAPHKDCRLKHHPLEVMSIGVQIEVRRQPPRLVPELALR
jgi:hypothetical protein